jgi:hypothetical protein
MTQKHYTPEFEKESFHCPHCGVYAKQIWKEAGIWGNGWQNVPDIKLAYCTHCGDKSIWFNNNMIEPNIGGVPLPNQDLPQDIIDDYYEARDILNKSPRGGAALLRLAIQKLCKELGEKGKNINDDIAELVKKGLPIKIQQALDYVRVVGNSAVHPGQIDLKDDKETAVNLFNLINLIAEVMITQPKEVDKLFNTLPQGQKDAIAKRDNKAGI